MKALELMELKYQKDSSRYFEQFRHLPLATFLDSCAADYEGEYGRYDIITALPSDTVAVTDDGTVVWQDCLKQTIKFQGISSPFDILSELLASIDNIDDQSTPFSGGVLGYWSYELATVLEPGRIKARQESSGLPLMCTGLFWWALVTDHDKKTTTLLFHPDIDKKTRNTVLQSLNQYKESDKESFEITKAFSAEMRPDQYKTAFDRVQDYILAGDCYEVNLTQRFSAHYKGDSWQAYLHLREVSPAPYSAYLSYPDINILSHSPERFIQVTERCVETHPIKGTIARGRTLEEDRTNAKLLQSSQKDRSENLMIVDLLRNDLGKVCKTGSVNVPKLFSLESYANVHHLVSSVTGILPDDIDAFQLMASVFPGGSITGAPKIRAMEIIRELEPAARSVYCGSIGYISCNGRMDTNIAIRTMVDSDNHLHCWGGGAIVSDSSCEQEYEESLTKVRNLMNALDSY